MEAILQQWEDFAREIWPDVSPSIRDLRDHAQEMLLAVIKVMQTTQSEAEQHEKSVGNGSPSAASDKVDSASARHAENRLESGFDIRALVAEYRALRASVLNLWSREVPDMHATQVRDMTRFNECVDQLLAESILSYSDSVEHSRELLLGILGHDLRSPLCAVSMMAGLLEEHEDLRGSSRQMASLIVVAAREMTQLVGDLLDFAGSHLGVRMHITRQPMNLDELGVCNQGPPIPDSLQAVIFDPLRRSSSNGMSRELGGFGLGLYIAREVVKAHGGDIEVRSDNRETAFIVKLPRGENPETTRTSGDLTGACISA